jgi:hypothetical protein
VLDTISSQLPDLVNQYISVRAQRLAKDAEVKEIKEFEEVLKDAIISKYREQGLKALGASNGVVKMSILIEPVAQDWIPVWEYIKETGAFDLLHKRLTNTAVKERWEAGVEIPGVGRVEVYKLSVSGAKS